MRKLEIINQGVSDWIFVCEFDSINDDNISGCYIFYNDGEIVANIPFQTTFRIIN